MDPVQRLGRLRRLWTGGDLPTDPGQGLPGGGRLGAQTQVDQGVGHLAVRVLGPAAAPAAGPPRTAAGTGSGTGEPKRIYLIYDQRDGEEPVTVTDYLFDQGFEVIQPVFEGDEAQIRRDHEESLSLCDAVLLYYGAGNELWLRAKLREVQKSAAYGRQSPIGAKAILVGPPDTTSKGRFRTHEAMVIDQRGAFDAAAMQPFLSQLRAGEEGA